MKQDFDKLFKVIDDAQSLTDGEIEKLVADLSDDERDMLNAVIATKRAMQRSDAQEHAEQVADEAWKAFSQHKFGGGKNISNLVPMRHMWHKIAAAAIAVVVISVPLFFALKKALSHTGFMAIINEKKEASGWWNPVTVILTAYCCVITLAFTMYLSSVSKIEKAQAEKEAAVSQQLADYEAKLDYLADELNITLPETESKAE